LFHKVEPYLTYLDYSDLEAKGADVETKLSGLENENATLRRELEELKNKPNEEIETLKKQIGEISKMLLQAGIAKKD
jgi:predicted nuclease with TOPRIM domain